MTDKKMRILWLSDSPTVNTGFGVVAKNLIDNICRQMGSKVEIVVVGMNIVSDVAIQYNKQVLVMDGRIDREGNTDTFCRGSFLDILKNDPLGYDGVFILQDIGIVDTIIDQMREIKAEKKKENKPSFKSVLYVPVDGYIGPKFFTKINFFDSIVTYTQYGKEMIAKSRPELKTRIKVIPHGCNPKDFYPIPKEEIRGFREDFFGANADKIIFINVNRNQPRKAIQDTIFAFIEAKANWTLDRKPFLYLNMGSIDPMGLDLRYVLGQTDLIEGKDYMIAPESFWTEKWGVETAVLNKIYNASDIYITTTLGEGWGLSVTEAMAVGIPVICPSHTSLTEIAGNGLRAYTLNNLFPTCSVIDNTIREQTDLYETADAMMASATALISGTDQHIVSAAKKYVAGLNWVNIAKEFVSIFETTFK